MWGATRKPSPANPCVADVLQTRARLLLRLQRAIKSHAPRKKLIQYSHQKVNKWPFQHNLMLLAHKQQKLDNTGFEPVTFHKAHL